MGRNKKALEESRSGKEAIAGFDLSTEHTGSLVDSGLPSATDEPAKGPKDQVGFTPTYPAGCYVQGQSVKAFFVILKPAPHGPAWFVTPALGTHEFSRIHFVDGNFTLGPDRPNRLGPEVIERVEYFGAGLGIQIRTTSYFIDVPQSVIQSVTWSR